jgi:hypothetical protein
MLMATPFGRRRCHLAFVSNLAGGRTPMKRRALLSIAVILAIAGLLIVAVLAYSGTYGLNVFLRRGVSVWVATKPDDTGLSRSMQIALQALPNIRAGAFTWHLLDGGLEVGELPVMAGENEVDRILLVRMVPAHFKFVVRNHPAGDRETEDWLKHLGAAVVINGSYFSRYGTPATPILSSGTLSGPESYDAKHGAFVASASHAEIRDLAKIGWLDAFRNADDAMVSYPLLIGADGSSRSNGHERWLANRSFVAQDHDGRIILGTTVEAFFSLNRLAVFLRQAPLGLKLALNLDGGPVACQAIAWKEYRRDFCGGWETTVQDGQLKLLKLLIGNRRWGLPIVLTVLHK